MEKTVKPKLKAKWSDSPLFWQSNYEFVAPYDFEECIRRLNALGIKYWNENQELWTLFFPSDTFGIDSQEDNGGVFNFKISGRGYKAGLTGQLLGNLVYENDRQTRVKVRTGFTWRSAILLFSGLPFWFAILIIATHSSNIVEIAVCFGISIIIFGISTFIEVGWAYSIKGQLYYDLYKALTPPRPRTLPP